MKILGTRRVTCRKQKIVGRDSAVGMATCYGMDGPGLKPARGKAFRVNPGWPKWLPGFFSGAKAAGT